MTSISLDAADPVGRTIGLSLRSWGGTHSASAQVSGATTMWRYWTPGWKSMSPPPSSACRAAMTSAARSLLGWPPAKSTIVPSSPTVDRLQRKATWSGARRSPRAAASMGARPVWCTAGS